MASKRRQALGKGLSALLGPPSEKSSPAVVAETGQDESKESSLLTIPVNSIRANSRQPRQDFDSETLQELADSIRVSGMVQPLVVRRSGEFYELVVGERRLRAAKMVGLTKLPCILVNVDDQESLVLALVENLQREDLNPIDEAEAFVLLRDEFHLSQEEVARRVGKSRSAVANSFRLLSLPPEMIEDVRDGLISAGHGRALLGITDEEQRRRVWREIKTKRLSVRETELMCQQLGSGRGRQTSAFTGRPKGSRDTEAESLSEQLMAHLGVLVKVKRRGSKRGRVELHFQSLEELDRILDLLGLRASERL
ncbi:ParB/RepB/Spo0J family partition protein [Candidatus Sumerlaeota bacterium]|nr:ParB/RepB/Spo0J family partition protein [Candidatus Sumerlaeota bacterium]